MHLSPTADRSTPHQDQFEILSATIAGSFLKLSFNQKIDADLAPSADDFSVTFPATTSAPATTIRPVLLELKEVDDSTRSVVVLVMDEDLPTAKEIEVHYHPRQILMWSTTTDSAIEAFVTNLPVKISGTRPSVANSPGLLEAIRLKKATQPIDTAKPTSPPEIISIDDDTIKITLNRELIAHQGVSLSDFRADIEGQWIELVGATMHQESPNKPHNIILKINKPLKLGVEVTVAFKAKRYPITAIDSSQISGFKTTARYIEHGKVEHLETSSQTTTVKNNPQAEEFHLKELETMAHANTDSGWALKGLSNVLLNLFSAKSSAPGDDENQPVKSGLKYFALGFVLVAGFVVYSLSSLFTAFTPEGESNPVFTVASSANETRSNDRKCTLNYQSGNYYSGDCLTGNTPHGWGIYEWTSGSRYEGEFENGKRDGQGSMDYADGSKYKGNWKSDKKDGIGTFWNPRGDRFEGKFNSGLMTNNGTCYRRNGTQVRGVCPS
ncbi:MORN repeat-containing protein [Sessilibacter corallicola]|uniref:MORN repeat protein n=1 Tax=Sessilibacter corallicola TaxID=2904075 RepID=A0ABQ0AB09_9GAMM|nr:hypothetical protein [Sessilibacter corallicola]MCE2028272.1 hypothetical protein [Sessilibacter corallicola]